MSNSSTFNRSVTLRDVADAAGVNPSTVSRALHNDSRLRAETRTYLQELARKMKYRPNPFVTAFATHVRNHRTLQHQASVALIDTYEDPGASRGWLARYEEGIRERATNHGFGVDVFRVTEHEDGLAGIAKILDARGIRGVLVLPVRGQTVLNGLDFSSMATATIDLSLRHPAMHRASPDYFQGMQLALDTLRARRCRRIGFCSYRGEVRRIGARWLGSYLAWNSEGLDVEQVAPHLNPYEDSVPGQAVGEEAAATRWRQCRDAFEKWLDQEKPDAIVSNDEFFLGWLRELGRRVPGDVAFASLGVAVGASTQSGIDQRLSHVGAAAIDLVISQIFRNEYGLPQIPHTVLVPPVWIDGDTTV